MKPGDKLPVATLIFIAANVIAAFALLWQPDIILEFGFQPDKPGFHTALTSLFLHQNLFHLFANMVFLAAVGPAVEAGAGTVRFVAVYFAGGLAGVLLHWLFTRQVADPAPLVGASGAIAACIAYYTTRYSKLQVMVAPKVGIPLLAMTAVWLLFQVLGAFVTITPQEGGTAYWTHLGGFAMGLLLSLVFRAPKVAQQEIGHKVVERMGERSAGAKLAALDRHLEEHPRDPKALRDKCEALATLGEAEKEQQVLLELLEVLPESEQEECLCRLQELGALARLPSLRRLLLAERFKDLNAELSRSLLLSVVRGDATDKQRPEALLALAGFDRESQPEQAAIWLRTLFAEHPLEPATELAKARGWAP